MPKVELGLLGNDNGGRHGEYARESGSNRAHRANVRPSGAGQTVAPPASSNAWASCRTRSSPNAGPKKIGRAHV